MWNKSDNYDYFGMTMQILQQNHYNVIIDVYDDGAIYWQAIKYIDSKNKIYDSLVADNVLALLGLMEILPDWKSQKKIDDNYKRRIDKIYGK